MYLQEQSTAAPPDLRFGLRGCLLIAVAGLLSAAIVGCADTMSSLNRVFNPEAQTSPENAPISITAMPPGAAASASPTEVQASPQAQATPHASHASKTSARAKAALASKQPAQAADSAASDTSEIPKPVVTLAEPADAPALSQPVQTPAPAGAPAASTIASAASDNVIRDKTDQLIREVNGAAKQIDEKNLTPDQIRSQSLALGLIHGAEKSFDDGDYSAADSLAQKASALLKSLPTVEQPLSTNK